jgi:hypothetical protein
MALIRICAYEITTFEPVVTETLTCCDPCHTPVGPGTQCNICCYNAKIDLHTTPPTLCFSYDAQFEYAYLDEHHHVKSEAMGEVDQKCGCACTFLDFCDLTGQSACIPLPPGVTLCPCGCGEPKVTCSATCDPQSIKTTPTSVSGEITIFLSVTNLCDPTTVCVETVPCSPDKIRYFME